MDPNELANILKQFQQSNQDFLEKIMADNQTKMEAVLKVKNHVFSIPKFREFNRIQDRWSTYSLQLEQHFEANNVNDDSTKRACLLSWIGSESLELLQKLITGKVNDKSFAELTTAFANHFQSKQHILAARFKFFKTTMKSGQSYADWVAELRGIARDCDFQCKKGGCEESSVDYHIRDMLVIHTPHDNVRSTALQKTNPTLEEVLQIATLYEETKQSCNEIKGESSSSSVNSIISKNHHQNDHRGRSRHRKPTRHRSSSRPMQKSCPGCGSSHQRINCYHYKKKSVCDTCSKVGHISAVCNSRSTVSHRSKSSNQSQKRQEAVNQCNHQQFHQVSAVDVINAEITEVQQSAIQPSNCDKIAVDINVNNQVLNFQVDTGATCTLVGQSGYEQLNKPSCEPVNQIVKAYGGHQIPIKGVANVHVKWNDMKMNLPLLIVNSKEASNILGLDWFKALKFQINIPNYHNSKNLCYLVSGQTSSQVSLQSAIKIICEQYPEIFIPSLGLCKSFKADIILKENAHPKYWKPYNLPFALYDDVKAEINRLVNSGVLKSIKSSEWASPIVIVKKPTGQIRICADFKVSVNSQIEIDRYPIPRIEELFHKLQGGQYFSKIDLSEAYLQIELTDEAKKIMVINTPFGLYQYQRLPFGIASAPGIFQRLMDEVTASIPGCAVYLDDIIVTGKTNDEHICNLKEVFVRLDQYGLKCKREKCRFAEEKIEYVGHIIDSKGFFPSEKRLDAIKLMPRPQNLKELEAFIGKLNYYNKFMPNFSSKAGPLNELRRQGVEFKWTNRQQTAFQELKDTIINAVQLVHYQSDIPLRLATDASKYGIGAVISHVYPDGSEHPISFASKTLTETQIGYSQIEKEALSIIYGVTKFHQYLYGRKFELVTDHQALTTLFNPNKKLPVMTLHRLQRWAIVLLSYNYTIRYNSTKHHANADALSRLPVGADPEFDREEKNMCNVYEVYQSIIDECPVNAKSVALFTKDDTILKEVGHMISNGWPATFKNSNIQDNLKPYFDRRFSLSLQNGIVLLQSDYTRVVIPVALRSQVLHMLHEGHWGKSRMKQMARRYVWFPKIDEEIEKVSKSCSICSSKASDPKKQFSPWPQATEPWERIHLDFAGPFFSRMWLIVVDSFSKFPYTIELQSATSATTISSLQKILSIEGLPRTIVSDNGTQFTSDEFKKFCELNSIEHLTIAPFHPASNGLAERFVRTFKESFSKLMMDSNDKDLALFKYLSTYRTTPDPVSGKSPAELLHGRQPRNILSVLMPTTKHTKAADLTKFYVGQQVHARNYSGKGKWIDGTIKKVVGRRMYVIQISNGIIRRHQNQLRQLFDASHEKESTSEDIQIQINNRSSSPHQQSNNDAEQSPPRSQPPAVKPILKRTPENPSTTPENTSTTHPDVSITQTPVRRTQRIRRKLVRFSPD